MNDFKLDADLQKRFGTISGLMRLVDEDGNVKGFLISAEMHSLVYEWAKTQFPVIENREPRSAKKYYSTPEAIARVKEIEATLRSNR